MTGIDGDLRPKMRLKYRVVGGGEVEPLALVAPECIACLAFVSCSHRFVLDSLWFPEGEKETLSTSSFGWEANSDPELCI